MEGLAVNKLIVVILSLVVAGCTTGKAEVSACAVVAERCSVVKAFSGDAAVRAAQLQPTGEK